MSERELVLYRSDPWPTEITFKLESRENEVLRPEHFQMYFYEQEEFILAFWSQFRATLCERDGHLVVSDAFIEAGGTPVGPDFWEWMFLMERTNALKARIQDVSSARYELT